LFKIIAEFNNPNINTLPSIEDINATLRKISVSILEVSNQFPRWEDASCIFTEPKLHPNTEEKQLDKSHSYYGDIDPNPALLEVVF